MPPKDRREANRRYRLRARQENYERYERELRLHLVKAPALKPWGLALIEHAMVQIGPMRVLRALKARRPDLKRLNELSLPLVSALVEREPPEVMGVALEAPHKWLRAYLVAHGLTLGDYELVPNC
jgi:hypothetical protein